MRIRGLVVIYLIRIEPNFIERLKSMVENKASNYDWTEEDEMNIEKSLRQYGRELRITPRVSYWFAARDFERLMGVDLDDLDRMRLLKYWLWDKSRHFKIKKSFRSYQNFCLIQVPRQTENATRLSARIKEIYVREIVDVHLQDD